MKKLFLALMAVASIALTGCDKKFISLLEEKISSEKVRTVTATNITSHSALLTGLIGVKIADYNSIEYGMLISGNESDVSSCNGKKLVGDKPVSQAFSITANSLSEETTYYYRAYLVLNAEQYEYGDVKSFETKKGASGNYQYVDLGLSVKWATFNVGASKPEEYGDYFAWGETSPKIYYDWRTYKWCDGVREKLTKYIFEDGGVSQFVDNKTTLEPEDDAATVNWGGNWRMPTKTEIKELLNTDNCTWEWKENYNSTDANGYLVTSKKTGNSIFLPAAGYRYDSSLGAAGFNGYYWSSSISDHGSPYANNIFFIPSKVENEWYYDDRCDGHSVRAVCK